MGGGGNAAPSLSRMIEFRNCLDLCGLVDISFKGQKFTWSKKRYDDVLVHEQLYQAVCNAQWREFFPEVTLYYLAHTKSDHTPILLHFDPSIPILNQQPFSI